MKDNGGSKGEGRETNVEKSKRVLRFVCPICGSRDLRVMEQARHYPIAMLDGVAVNAETVKFEELRKREECPYWLVDDPKEEWECWCVECEFVPDLEQYDEEKTKEDKLVRWLLDNCPQTQEEDD